MISKLRIKIAELTPRKSQKEIARELDVHRNTVYRTQKALGVTARSRTSPSRAKERKILALLRSGVSRAAIETSQHATVHAVRRIAEAHGITTRQKLTEVQTLQVLADIVGRNASALAISKRRGVPHKTVLAMAHQVLKCERFLPSAKNPLQSYFPSVPPQPMNTEHDAVPLMFQLVHKICTRFLDGKLPTPAHEADFVHVASSIAVSPEGSVDLNGFARSVVLEFFEQQLRQAIGEMRRSQDVRWQN
jgi:Homeodomain-like domain